MIKIIDFGIACQTKTKQKITNRLGTPYYMAPEVWTKYYD
jgi:serine/threonine protein kinase